MSYTSSTLAATLAGLYPATWRQQFRQFGAGAGELLVLAVQFDNGVAGPVGQCAVRARRQLPAGLGRRPLRRRAPTSNRYNFSPTIAYKINDMISVARRHADTIHEVIYYAWPAVPVAGFSAISAATALASALPPALPSRRPPTHAISASAIAPQSIRRSTATDAYAGGCRRDFDRLGQYHAQSAGHGHGRFAPAHGRPLHAAGRLRMVELEPHRHGDVFSRMARTATVASQTSRCRSNTATAISIRSAANMSSTASLDRARRHRL